MASSLSEAQSWLFLAPRLANLLAEETPGPLRCWYVTITAEVSAHQKGNKNHDAQPIEKVSLVPGVHGPSQYVDWTGYRSRLGCRERAGSYIGYLR